MPWSEKSIGSGTNAHEESVSDADIVIRSDIMFVFFSKSCFFNCGSAYLNKRKEKFVNLVFSKPLKIENHSASNSSKKKIIIKEKQYLEWVMMDFEIFLLKAASH